MVSENIYKNLNKLIRLEEENTVTKKKLNKEEFNLALLLREIEQIQETKSEKSSILTEIESQMNQLDDLISEKNRDFDLDSLEHRNELQNLQENKEVLTNLKTQMKILEDEMIDAEKELTEWTGTKGQTEGQVKVTTESNSNIKNRLQALENEIEIKTAKNHEFRGLIDSKVSHFREGRSKQFPENIY